jgi:uncharacterized protein YxjI
MRYIVRERIFTIGDKFQIEDENEMPRFEVVGKVFSLGNKLNIYDMMGRNVVYIEQRIFRFLPEYNIFLGDRLAANIKKEFTFFKPKFNIESDFGRFSVDGDILAHDFSILKDSREVARINKKWLSLSDTYMVDVNNTENQAFILAIVIVLDQVLYDNKATPPSNPNNY